MGFGRNAGSKRHYYRVALPMAELWQGYAGWGVEALGEATINKLSYYDRCRRRC
jgi:hypothetical protein